jgi:AhpD family alkylhydroperoxidase
MTNSPALETLDSNQASAPDALDIEALTAKPVDAATVDIPVRVAVDDLAPHMSKAMAALERACRQTQLERQLQELVRLRASQLNGCAYCVDSHSHDAREGGETEQRLYAVAVWREAPFFTTRERAALALTEAGTRLTDGPVSDEVVGEAAKHFSDVELAELIWLITAINAWNRLGAIAHPWPIETR